MNKLLWTALYTALAAATLAMPAHAEAMRGRSHSLIAETFAERDVVTVAYNNRRWRGSNWNNRRHHHNHNRYRGYRNYDGYGYYGRPSYGYGYGYGGPGLFLNFGGFGGGYGYRNRGYGNYSDGYGYGYNRRWR